MNPLNRLILEALDEVNGYQVPESTLKKGIMPATRPVTTGEQWDDAIIYLLQKEMIGFSRDDIDDTKKFYIKEKGQTALRR